MNIKKIINIIYDNIKTLIGALIIAVLIRSLLFQPFYIPSSSMEPTLLVGDRIFVSKLVEHSFLVQMYLIKDFFKIPRKRRFSCF